MRLLRPLLATLLLAFSASNAEAADLWRPKGQPAFVDGNGNPYAAAKICFYEAGTTDQLTVYKDADEQEAWAQPITLNSSGALSDPVFVPQGEFKEVWLSSDATDCDSGTTLFTADDIPGALNAEDLGISFARAEQPVLTRASSFEVDPDELGYLYNIDTSGGSVTVTLPSVAAAGDGARVTIRKATASNSVVIDPADSETVNGAATHTLSAQYDNVTLVSDGATWNAVDTVVNGTVTFAEFASSAYDTDPTLAAASATRVPTQSAVKAYVDASAASGIKWKDPVRVATTTDGTLATAFDDGSEVDGITLATGDRILIKNQSDPAENGIYAVEASGAPTRATDADQDDELPGATVFVEEGDTNAASQWTQTTNPVTVGSSNIVFSLIAAGTTYSAGTGLDLTGSTFSVEAGGIDTTQLADEGVTSAKISAAAVGLTQLSAVAAGRLMQIGTVFDYTGSSCPAYSVEGYGQTLSRSTYSAWFAVCAACGPGDGSTTFTAPDLRGRVVAGEDDMGGSSANRLTAITDSLNGDTLGATGGVEGAAVAQTNLADFSRSISVSGTASGSMSGSTSSTLRDITTNSGTNRSAGEGTNTNPVHSVSESHGAESVSVSGTLSVSASGTWTSGGSGTALSKVQPTIVLKKCIHTGV